MKPAPPHNLQVREELESAVEEDDTAALEGLRDQLAAFAEVLDAAFTKKKIPERTQIWIQISLFELYELLYTAVEALGQSDKSLLELLQVGVGSVWMSCCRWVWDGQWGQYLPPV